MSIIGGNRKHGFDAYGEKILRAEHMRNWMDSPLRVDPEGISFELGAGIDEVEDGFFILLPTIKELFILNPNCHIIMSDETIKLFKQNNVLIRGEFDGNVEEFAKEYGLRFLHRDVELAVAGEFESYAGVDKITLCFRPDGSAYLHQDNQCQYGGGEKMVDLPEDFYSSMTAEQIADKCLREECCKEIKAKGVLEGLLGKAKNKGGFSVDYSI